MKRDFNLAGTISNTIPANILQNLAGKTLQPGSPTGENDYRPATVTPTTASDPYDTQMPAGNYFANAFQQQTNGAGANYVNGFGDVGTPRKNTNLRGAVTDVLMEDIKNAVYSNLPEPYRYDSPRVTRYVQQLTLVAATVFQKQVRAKYAVPTSFSATASDFLRTAE